MKERIKAANERPAACPVGVKDGPILSQARSRSKGPLSDQVADAPNPRVQCRSWVDPCRSAPIRRTAVDGAPFSLQRLPAKVSSLNAERPLGLGGANWPSAHNPVI